MGTTGLIEEIARQRRRVRFAWLMLTTLAAVLAVGIITGCETSTAATNAATQLTKVSQQLSDYYTDLSNQVDDTITLNQIQAEMLGVSVLDGLI